MKESERKRERECVKARKKERTREKNNKNCYKSFVYSVGYVLRQCILTQC
jgi:hypothetical protein